MRSLSRLDLSHAHFVRFGAQWRFQPARRSSTLILIELHDATCQKAASSGWFDSRLRLHLSNLKRVAQNNSWNAFQQSSIAAPQVNPV
jgi:hypothetical protein